MKLPRYSATTSPPRSSGLVRATDSDIKALTQTSEQAKWSGVGAFGRGLNFAGQLSFAASQHRRALDDDIESGKVTQKVLDKFSLAKDAASRFDASADQPLPGDPNFDKVITTFDTTRRDLVVEDLLKGVDKDASKIFSGIKSPRVKAKLVNWYNEIYRNEADGVRKVVGGKLDEYQTTEINKLREASAKNGDIEKANYYANLMDENELITHGKAEVLKKENKVIADTSITTMMAQAIMAQTGYQDAIEFVAAQDIDVAVRDKVLSDLATQERIQATRHKQERENTMRTMLADVWDGKLKDPQAVTIALRAGYLDDTDAKYLRDAIKNPDPPKTTNEALIAIRYAIDDIGAGTETRESALKTVIAYTEQLSPTDGKSFIKEIFGEHDTKNAFWNRQAQEYMEKQIMEVASLTGILYGSGEQLALSAQALMSYDEAKKAAIAEGKPLKGKELLELAHQTMLPFRSRVKPLVEGEKIPETLGGRIVGKTEQPAKTKRAPKRITVEEMKATLESYPEPKTEKDFNSTISHIPTKEAKILYFEAMIKRIKDDKLAKRIYERWSDELYK